MRPSWRTQPESPSEARRRMVEWQLRGRDIRDERVLAAMGRVPRELFVPEELRSRAYDDAALPIGAGQTISQPYMVARICAASECSTSGRGRATRRPSSPSWLRRW
jgi:protein-L-isoaspartate(D-aspartate) O-methyltransferase